MAVWEASPPSAMALRKLLNTWQGLFPNAMLAAIAGRTAAAQVRHILQVSRLNYLHAIATCAYLTGVPMLQAHMRQPTQNASAGPVQAMQAHPYMQPVLQQSHPPQAYAGGYGAPPSPHAVHYGTGTPQHAGVPARSCPCAGRILLSIGAHAGTYAAPAPMQQQHQYPQAQPQYYQAQQPLQYAGQPVHTSAPAHSVYYAHQQEQQLQYAAPAPVQQSQPAASSQYQQGQQQQQHALQQPQPQSQPQQQQPLPGFLSSLYQAGLIQVPGGAIVAAAGDPLQGLSAEDLPLTAVDRGKMGFSSERLKVRHLTPHAPEAMPLQSI